MIMLYIGYICGGEESPVSTDTTISWQCPLYSWESDWIIIWIQRLCQGIWKIVVGMQFHWCRWMSNYSKACNLYHVTLSTNFLVLALYTYKQYHCVVMLVIGHKGCMGFTAPKCEGAKRPEGCNKFYYPVSLVYYCYVCIVLYLYVYETIYGS